MIRVQQSPHCRKIRSDKINSPPFPRILCQLLPALFMSSHSPSQFSFAGGQMETKKNTTEIARSKPRIEVGDRFSSLPDEIISHILSFLQTKYAVGTAVLSRRWKDLWARVTNLDFDNRLISQPPPGSIASQRLPELAVLERRLLEFSRFVSKVLSQHKNLDSVRRFRFHCSTGHRERNVSRSSCFWLERELVFGPLVEEIDVMIEEEAEFGLPHCIPQSFYTLKNLKIVKLEGVTLSAAAKGSVFLPSLKMLQLCEVQIRDCESLSSLVSGCPVLETAILEGCCLSYRKVTDILILSLPSLKNLKMVRFGNYGMCPIEIEAPNLEELDLEEFAELKFVGSNPFACLHSAHVDIGMNLDDVLIGVLNQIANAKRMYFSGRTLDHLSGIHDVRLPDFPNLTHLTIETGGSSSVLLSLLGSASRLHSLVIDMGASFGSIEWKIFEHLWTPKCLLSSVEEIEIKDLVETKDEMRLVEYLLEAGVVLKKVKIHVQGYQLGIKRRKRLASLLKLPRGSSSCEARLLLPNNEEISIDSDDANGIYDDMDDDDDFNDSDGALDDDLRDRQGRSYYRGAFWWY